jgi:hypothetical protein
MESEMEEGCVLERDELSVNDVVGENREVVLYRQ